MTENYTTEATVTKQRIRSALRNVKCFRVSLKTHSDLTRGSEFLPHPSCHVVSLSRIAHGTSVAQETFQQFLQGCSTHAPDPL